VGTQHNNNNGILIPVSFDRLQADVTASFDGSYSGTVEYGVTCDKNNAGGTFGCEKLSSHTGGFDHTSTFSGTEQVEASVTVFIMPELYVNPPNVVIYFDSFCRCVEDSPSSLVFFFAFT